MTATGSWEKKGIPTQKRGNEDVPESAEFGETAPCFVAAKRALKDQRGLLVLTCHIRGKAGRANGKGDTARMLVSRKVALNLEAIR